MHAADVVLPVFKLFTKLEEGFRIIPELSFFFFGESRIVPFLGQFSGKIGRDPTRTPDVLDELG